MIKFCILHLEFYILNFLFLKKSPNQQFGFLPVLIPYAILDFWRIKLALNQSIIALLAYMLRKSTASNG